MEKAWINLHKCNDKDKTIMSMITAVADTWKSACIDKVKQIWIIEKRYTPGATTTHATIASSLYDLPIDFKFWKIFLSYESRHNLRNPYNYIIRINMHLIDNIYISRSYFEFPSMTTFFSYMISLDQQLN